MQEPSYTCVFCGCSEHSPNLLICSNCVQTFTQLEPEQLKKLKAGLLKLNQTEKLNILEKHLFTEDTNGTGTGSNYNVKERINRKRFGRASRFDKRANFRPAAK